jgi:starvation-inducible DNA-binding protein
MTESYYEHAAKQYDELAERILQLGGKPFATAKDYLANAVVKEESGNDFDSKTVLNSILADFETLAGEYRKISKAASEAGDAPTQNMADENAAWFEKQIWMLKASLA